MSYIQAQNLTFSHHIQAQALLSDLSFQIAAPCRIGLIGPNGAGKSTLLKLIQGAILPDAGRLYRRPQLRVGFLSQHPLAGENTSAGEALWAGQPALRELQARCRQGDLAALMAYEALGGYDYEQRIERLSTSMGWSEAALRRPVEGLSGGERTRLALLRLMLEPPELLLLDEPSNALDQPMLDWLEDWLVTTPISWLMVSHDRHLLEGTAETIWELERGRLTIRQGSFSSFRQQQEHEAAHRQRQFQQQRRKARQLEQVAQERRRIGESMENFRPARSIRANGGICARDEGSVHAQVRTRNVMRAAKAAAHRAERANAAALELQPQKRRERPLHFSYRPLRVRHVLSCEQLGLTRGGRSLFANLNLQLAPGQRLAIVGANGSGKSSLLELLAGRRLPDQGTIAWAQGVRIGYAPQAGDRLAEQQTALENVVAGEPGRLTLGRTLLACLGLVPPLLAQPVGALSSGERGKVALAALIAAEPDVLLLDEPTNHLELPAREALEHALQAFPGTLILVSHDRWFRNALGCRELAL